MNLKLAGLFVLVAAALQANLMAKDWPGFRGPNGDGTSSDKNVATKWSDSDNLKWKLKLPGKGYSSPIVVGDRVFVTTYGSTNDLSKLKRHLVCVNRKTGSISWSKEIATKVADRGIPQFAGRPGYASHTPVSDGERVYGLYGNAGVVAFDLDGKQLWQQDVGTEGRAMFGSSSSPILYKNQLIVTAGAESESIRSLDLKTGKQIWKTDAGSLSKTYSTPLIAANAKGEDELLISVAYEVWGLNPTTGKLRWYSETRVDTAACPGIVAKDGIAYLIGGRSGGRTAVELGGKDDVTKTHVKWSTTGGSYVPSPVIVGGHMYWVNDRGVANCVDIKTGKQVGTKRLGGQYYASMVVANNRLYAVSRFDGTHVLEASPDLKELAHNSLDDESDFSASPAISDGQLFIRSDSSLYCIKAVEGTSSK
jgi:outer membrane protein assembly factor BamB